MVLGVNPSFFMVFMVLGSHGYMDLLRGSHEFFPTGHVFFSQDALKEGPKGVRTDRPPELAYVSWRFSTFYDLPGTSTSIP